MNNRPLLRTIRFETEKLDYVEAGVDFREGTRLYGSAVIGRVHLYLNGDELCVERRIPDEFDVSDTVKSMFEMSSEFERTGSASANPFCCVCGDRGCAYLDWRLETVDSETRLIMEDLVGNPIGAHQYRLQPKTLYNAVAELAETVVATMKDAGIRRTTAGTIQEFVDWHQQLVQWKENEL
ncbi:hypothetical protein SAMN04487950_2776 [Halogranum rubrum]|uniref:Uncharacterized protein n=1 Tax=Halogranum rubrum TaxID=553466 RepID=A0A1I4FCR1_9EURY|nr:hypothetical protein [Halogranum rubrum]SFL15694.1 hypothetical protein SAMN04487950_2776 [Halogranum rubrum]